MKIEWFGAERNKPIEVWVICNQDSTTRNYSDGTPVMFSSYGDAVLNIFCEAVDKAIEMGAENLSDKGITPVLFEYMILLQHHQDIPAMREMFETYEFIHNNQSIKLLKTHTNGSK